MHDQMNCFKGLTCFTKQLKCSTSVLGRLENGVLVAKNDSFLSSLAQRGYVAATSLVRDGYTSAHPQKISNSARDTPWKIKLPFGLSRNTLGPEKCAMSISFRHNHGRNSDPDLSRDFLVQLWVEDNKRLISEENRSRKIRKHLHNDVAPVGSQSSFEVPRGSFEEMKSALEQPPTSQPVTGFLKPTSLEEALVAPLLARSNLLITRDIEWANLTVGFEQENRYAVVDLCYPHSPVGYIREKSNVIARQLLRSRRPFSASITDALGSELFRVRRPFWWITSSIYTEINGKEIGVVHRRWHLWKRIYDLYLGNMQFAVVENPGFWNWTFTLKDINGEVLAEIDRNWRGFGFELFTDAGQYVIRFGTADPSYPDGESQELQVNHPLTLAQRAVAVALAISLDNDYFSRHGGVSIPFFVVGE
ncbi:altered inheritance rate of mitochondria protein 25-like isoform X2 [Coffea arabica]|uniref:Phospholipid scramblase n=1 Tax=Coffea arabica TaxID=13443 RepID=A0A6P6WTA0_COFAR|nr:altered inheritance rate of mitochondria protein 25-like isoform X1 [Coffea arabica]